MIETCEPTTPPVRKPARAYWSAVGGMALYLAFFLAMTLFNAHPPKLPGICWALLAPLTTVAYLLILVYSIRLISRLALTVRLELLLMFSALLLFMGFNPSVRTVILGVLHGKGVMEMVGAVTTLEMSPLLEVIVPFFLILTGIFFGQLIARMIRERALLAPVALIAGMIDFWGVYWGPVSIASEAAPAAVSNMATAATAAATVPPDVTLPSALAWFGHIAPPENIGIGDFVFLAFFLTCAYRLGFSAKRTMWGIFTGLLLASVLMALDGQLLFGREIAIEYLPGLLFICGGLLLANLREWKLTRQEWAMTGALVGLLGVLIGTSVLRAELAKPRVKVTNYTLTASTGQQMATQALKRVSDEVAPAAAIPLAGRFVYAITPQGPRLARWGIVVLARKQKVTMRNTRDVLITGERVGGNWRIRQESTSPPNAALGLLMDGMQKKAAPELLIRQAAGISPAGFTLLDNVPDFADSVAGSKYFMIRLNPNGGIVINELGQKVKELPYAP